MSKIKEKINNEATQLKLPFPKPSTQYFRAGSLRTKEAVVEAIRVALKKCPLDREQVANEIERLCGEPFSVHVLNGLLSETKTNRRFPLELVKALTMITGDLNILKAALEPEYFVLDKQSKVIFEYGKLVLESKDRTKRKRQLEQMAAVYVS